MAPGRNALTVTVDQTGPAVTISYFPSCSASLDPDRYNLANLFYEAVGDEPAGKVVVLASNGYTDTSLAGGTKLLRLHQRGCAGVLTDRRLRDFDELARYEFAAYCSGEATRWGGDSVTPFQANVPVVLNRVASPVYPDTICGVVYQGSERRTGCQFSFTCDGSMKARRNQRQWREAELMAGAVMAGIRAPVSRNATHYHADYVSPPWADTLSPTAVIGTHKFYRFPSKSIVAAAPAAM